LTSDLVAVIHNCRIGSFYWQKRRQQGHCPIVGISINGASTIFSLASWVIYVPIGCRHPFMRYSLPSDAKTTATCPLLNPENKCQWSINCFRSCVFGNEGNAQILVHTTALLTALIGKNTIY